MTVPPPPSTAETLAILVVDDNKVNTLVAVAMIQALGHEATAVHDGESAVKAVIRESWSLVLMDLSMPGMDGLTATERIREWERHGTSGARVPIVALTAHTLPNIRAVCMASGMDYYLAKPLRQEDLVRVIGTYGSGRSRTGQFAVQALVDPVGRAAMKALPPAVAKDVVRRFARDARIGLANLADALKAGQDSGEMAIYLRGALTQVGASQALEQLDRMMGLVAIGHQEQAQKEQESLGTVIEATITALEM